jgi:F0F1-type ATP synthase assembly protein I
MKRPNDPRSLERTLKAFQNAIQAAQPAMAASYAVIGSILVCGGIGYALDAWSGRRPVFLVGGLVLGVVVGLYQLARTLWHR